MTLAQATSTPSAPAAPPAQGWDVLLRQMLPLFLIIAVFWWWMGRSRRKERQAFENLLSSLKRNDRVQTIGGVYGTVVDVRGNEVVLKVDETNNVKIRFNRSAIKEVIREQSDGGS
jgi:preprotein translocase subunit YajC